MVENWLQMLFLCSTLNQLQENQMSIPQLICILVHRKIAYFKILLIGIIIFNIKHDITEIYLPTHRFKLRQSRRLLDIPVASADPSPVASQPRLSTDEHPISRNHCDSDFSDGRSDSVFPVDPVTIVSRGAQPGKCGANECTI